jgi:RNA recognition motif. (a.k.a. RRM, RBD, or RNP domain)
MNMILPSAAFSISKQSTESTDCRSKLEEDRPSFLKISPGELLSGQDETKGPPALNNFPVDTHELAAATAKAQGRRAGEENSAVHSCKIVRMHRAGKTIVFLKNLRKSTKRDTVLSAFSKYGLIVHVQLPFNTKKKRNLGYCYLAFQDDRVARHLIDSVRQVELEDRTVLLDPFAERPVIHKAETKPSKRDLPVQSTTPGRSLTPEGVSVPGEAGSKKGNACAERPTPRPPAHHTSPSSSSLQDLVLLFAKPTRSSYFQSSAHLHDWHTEGNVFFRVNRTPVCIRYPI